MARAFGYVRVSSLKQLQGESIEAQSDLIRRTWAARPNMHTPSLMERGIELIEPFYEEAISAYKREFLSRPAGMLLNANLQRGDHILFAIHTRAFRRASDWSAVDSLWRNRGISYHFCNIPGLGGHVDASQAAGWMLIASMMTGAQMEGEQRSITGKMSIHYRRSQTDKPFTSSSYAFQVIHSRIGPKRLKPLPERFADLYQAERMVELGYTYSVANRVVLLNKDAREKGTARTNNNSRWSSEGPLVAGIDDVFANPHWASVVAKLPAMLAKRYPKGLEGPRGEGLRGAYHLLDERVLMPKSMKAMDLPAIMFARHPAGPRVLRRNTGLLPPKAPSAAAVDKARILMENARARERASRSANGNPSSST